jgi:phosphomannomutase
VILLRVTPPFSIINTLDKDGIVALGVMARFAHELYTNASTLTQALRTIYSKYGWVNCFNGYVLSHDKTTTDRMFDEIRFGINGTNGVKGYPVVIAGVEVESVRDLTVGYDSSREDTKPVLPSSKSTQMITFR